MTALGAALALLVGFVLGLLGGGGSVLTVPILIYALHIPVKQAIATSLCVVGLVAFIGFLSHWRQGTVSKRTAGVFGSFAIVAAYAGGRLSEFVPEQVQLTLFGVVGLIGSALMLRGGSGSTVGESDDFEFEGNRQTILLLALKGIVIGLLTGVIGVGGGFLIVPGLVLLAKLPMRKAVGTSLLVVTMNSLSGFLGHLGVVRIDWHLVGWFTAIAGIGSVIGTMVSRRVAQARLRQVFGLLLVAVSIYVLVRR